MGQGQGAAKKSNLEDLDALALGRPKKSFLSSKWSKAAVFEELAVAGDVVASKVEGKEEVYFHRCSFLRERSVLSSTLATSVTLRKLYIWMESFDRNFDWNTFFDEVIPASGLIELVTISSSIPIDRLVDSSLMKNLVVLELVDADLKSVDSIVRGTSIFVFFFFLFFRSFSVRIIAERASTGAQFFEQRFRKRLFDYSSSSVQSSACLVAGK
jgi:hypothetical protein